MQMPQYNLTSLGSTEFERMVQALLKEVIGSGTITFGAGRDGAREATYQGSAPYPSTTARWDGTWIFQAKFHDTDLLGVDKARKAVLKDLETELDKIVLKYRRHCDNYILVTNVPLSGVAGSGTLDVIADKIIPQHSGEISNVHVWGADDINRLLEKYPAVRNAYLHFMVAGDLIAQLIDARQRSLDDLALTIRSYLNVTFTREQHAQLDQAGDVSDDQLPLQQVFFDLNSEVEPEYRKYYAANESMRARVASQEAEIDRTAAFLLSEAGRRVVLIGGPGEGKSTLGQYLAQLHRATLLNRIGDIVIAPDYIPATPRIPLRVTLRDFGQWLANIRTSDESNHGTLEEYICFDIQRTTSRTISPNDLHNIIRGNPTLLILDGLDEVTDLSLRKVLLSRLSEFTGRCDTVIKADVQILASTRPTSYIEQFDPHNFLHLRLTKLKPEQVMAYVSRWTKAKNLDPTKEDRVIRTAQECLADRDISLLTSTPLQVTILLLIISSGGKPQYQREALFNDYLEIIYRRETAKGRNIIESDKELLIGLHRYIGYVLHEKTTQPETTGAVLPLSEYSKAVEVFLRWNDPYAMEEKRQSDLAAITKEAGERLVLIIEPTKDHFGFELRSIQEFFAACHLSDTPVNTEQRYLRFDVIARLLHWRNVALFFAGRVGRNYPGEASNIIEVCRSIDHEVPGCFTRQGAGLAIELAADRAFGPNRRWQQSLIELGLEMFDDRLSPVRMGVLMEHLLRLSLDDQKDLVLPLLERRVELLSLDRIPALLLAIYRIDPGNRHIPLALAKMAAHPEHAVDALILFLSFAEPQTLDQKQLIRLLRIVDDSQVSRILSRFRGKQLLRVVECLGRANLPTPMSARVTSSIVRNCIFSLNMREDIEVFGRILLERWPSDPSAIISRGMILHSYLSMHAASVMSRTLESLPAIRENLPAPLKSGNISELVADIGPVSPIVELPLWLAHLTMGDVTEETVDKFLIYFRKHRRDPAVARLIHRLPWEAYFFLDILLTESEYRVRPRWEKVRRLIVHYGGWRGSDAWEALRSEIRRSLVSTGRAEVEAARVFGMATISNKRLRRKILDSMDEPFAEQIADYAMVRRAGPFDFRGAAHALKGTILSIEREKTINSLQTLIIRRATLPRSRTGIKDRGVYTDLIKCLVDVRPGGIARDLVPRVLACAYAYGPVPDEIARPALQVIGETNDTADIMFTTHTGGTNLYEAMLRIADEELDSSVRRGAHLMIQGAALDLHYSSYEGVHPRSIRFRNFAQIHRSLARSGDEYARLTSLALFVARVPSAQVDWKLLGDLVRSSCGESETRMLECINMASWDDDKLWACSVDFLQDVIPDISDADIRAILVEWLEALLGKGNQSLRSSEEALGLPLQPL